MRSVLRPLIYLAVALAVVAGTFAVSYRYFVSAEMSLAEGRLSLYRSSVVAELERFSHLTYVLARDPVVIEAAQGGGPDRLDGRLRAFAAEAGLDAIYLMRPDGVTISASNAGDAGSFVGEDYSFRPYFTDALSGRQGRFYGIGATTGLPGYFIADAVRGPEGGAIGVIAIKLDLTKLEDSWNEAGERVLLADRSGIVLLASQPEWRYRALAPLGATERARIAATRQFPGQDLAPLDWMPGPDGRAEIAGDGRLHLTAQDLPHGWELHFFASDGQAVLRSWLLTGAAVLVAALILVLFQVQRTRRMGAALRRSEEEEAQLRQANEALAREIEERRVAERRLERTRGELERASRLAALGTLAASVTHELGQPIAAMRNHLAAAEIGGGAPGRLTGALTGLVDRMEGITRQLKFFARSGGDDFGEVDLVAALAAARALVAPNIETHGVQVTVTGDAAPLMVRGNRLRIEQVLTNLLRNAVDAVEGTDTPRIEITLCGQGEDAACTIADSGHGLGEATLADLQEPFVTTRESGQGMGLGLAITAGIVADHGGALSAENRPGGGAVFRVTFPLAAAEKRSAA